MQKIKNPLYFLSGSIIHPQVILSAAHCTLDTEYAIVIVGTHDLLLNDSNVLKIKVNNSDFKTHPDFNFHYAHMDIAVIHLPQPLTFNDFTQPVEISSKYLLEESFAGEIATTAGHGQYCDDNCGSSSTLRFSKNRVMSNEECEGESPFGTFPTESQICISTSEKDAGASCKGDSGSGLTINRNNKTILIGISSFGSRKCEDGKPAVFTRLTREVVEWIRLEAGI